MISVMDGESTASQSLVPVSAPGVVALPYLDRPGALARRRGTAVAWVHEVPAIAEVIASGGTVRMVGPQYLLDGLRSGAYELTKHGSTFTAVVRDSGTGRIVGHLTFESVGWSRALAGAGFHVTSLVTLQYYLYEINACLDRILHEVASLRQFVEARADAELDACDALLDEVIERVTAVGRFDEFALSKLAQVKTVASVAHAHALRVVNTAAEEMREAVAAYETASEKQGILVPLKTLDLKARLDAALTSTHEAVPSAVRLLRSIDILTRSDVLESFTVADFDAEARFEQLRSVWVARAETASGLIHDLGALESADREEIKRLIAFEGNLLKKIDRHSEYASGLAEASESLVETLSREPSTYGAVDIVQTRKGAVLCPATA